AGCKRRQVAPKKGGGFRKFFVDASSGGMLRQVPTSKARRRKDMKTRLLTSGVLALGLALVSPAGAAPKATKYQTTITSPTSGVPPVDAIKITKTSKLAVKATKDN